MEQWTVLCDLGGPAWTQQARRLGQGPLVPGRGSLLAQADSCKSCDTAPFTTSHPAWKATGQWPEGRDVSLASQEMSIKKSDSHVFQIHCSGK